MQLVDYLLDYLKRFVSAPLRNKFFLCTRLGGKSFASSFIACHEALSRDNTLVLVISTGYRASLSWLEKAQQFAEAIKVLSDGNIDYQKTSDKIQFTNGSKIISLPSGNPSALRGYTSQCVIIDECFFIERPNEVLAAINPTLTRSSTSKLILCSTPGSKLSPFFEIYQKAKTDPNWYCQTTTIHDCIKDGLVVDIDLLHQLCPDPNVFSQEFECKFLDGIGLLIDTSLIQYYNEEKEYVDYFIGADFARTSDGTSFCVLGRTREGHLHLCDLVNLHNVEYAKQIAIATQLFNKYLPKEFLGDAGGLGSPLCEQLNRTVSTRIKGFTFTGTSKPDSYEYFRKTVFDRKLFIREDFKTMMLEDLSLIEQVISESGKTTYVARHYNGSHADNVSALVLALQAERNNKQNAAMPTSFSFNSAFGQRRFRM